MPRLTITLSDERRRAVKEAAARRGITITALIDECLELAGVRTMESARSIVARARGHAGLSPDDATALALREAHAERSSRP